MVDFSEQRPAEHLRSGFLRLDDHAAQQREIDHETIVDATQARAVVAAAADGDIEAGLAPGLHSRDHVRNVCALRDHARTLVDHRVVQLAGILVTGVAGLDDPSPESRPQRLEGVCNRDSYCHSQLLPSVVPKLLLTRANF